RPIRAKRCRHLQPRCDLDRRVRRRRLHPPLDESTVDRREFLPKPIETCVYEGKLRALPFNTDAGLLYYRTDLVQPPDSWSQLARSVQDVLADPDHDPRQQAGYAGQLARYEGLTVNALEAIQAAAPGSAMVRNGKVTVSLNDIQAGIDRLRPGRGVVLVESLQYDEERSTQAFRDGKVLFMRNWPVAYRALSPPIGEESAGPAVPFAVTPLPGDSVLGGQNLAVAANSTKPRAAQALIEFLTDARSQQILFERGGLAATREVVYHDAEVKARYPYVQTLLQAVQSARPRPVTPCYRMFSEEFQDAVDQALREAKPLPESFIDTLQAALNC
ncbi:MAG: extracellular solute-binding protein, partial [Actinobacteria bacterium]|nr:extracellular solute-binding protein [Actinomycetota bacterium]